MSATSSTITPVFKGWAGLDVEAAKGKLVFQDFEPKEWDEDDVEVAIQYCGICGTDQSALEGEWSGGDVSGVVPQICGHEICGKVTRVGSTVEGGLKVGDIVGVGYQSDSCRECESCLLGEENHCPKMTPTFNGPYRRGNGSEAKSHGGFAKFWRGPSRFAVKVPEGLDAAQAAPLFCGGITVWTPLTEYKAGSAKVKNVGVIGIGGLGHFAIQFASAMGATVTAISRSDAKKDEAIKLGASKLVATGNDVAAGLKDHASTLDLIICTINPTEMNVADYLSLLRPHGTMVLVGIVPKPVEVPMWPLITNNRKLAGSLIGSPSAIKEMLAFALEHKIRSWIQKWNMDDINKALPSFAEGHPRFRYVLVNEDNGGKL